MNADLRIYPKAVYAYSRALENCFLPRSLGTISPVPAELVQRCHLRDSFLLNYLSEHSNKKRALEKGNFSQGSQIELRSTLFRYLIYGSPAGQINPTYRRSLRDKLLIRKGF